MKKLFLIISLISTHLICASELILELRKLEAIVHLFEDRVNSLIHDIEIILQKEHFYDNLEILNQNINFRNTFIATLTDRIKELVSWKMLSSEYTISEINLKSAIDNYIKDYNPDIISIKLCIVDAELNLCSEDIYIKNLLQFKKVLLNEIIVIHNKKIDEILLEMDSKATYLEQLRQGFIL